MSLVLCFAQRKREGESVYVTDRQCMSLCLTHTLTHTYTRTHTHTYIRTHRHAHTGTHTHTHIHAHIHAYTYTHTHTHTHTLLPTMLVSKSETASGKSVAESAVKADLAQDYVANQYFLKPRDKFILAITFKYWPHRMPKRVRFASFNVLSRWQLWLAPSPPPPLYLKHSQSSSSISLASLLKTTNSNNIARQQ